MVGAPRPAPEAGSSLARAGDGAGLYVHLPFCASRCGYCTFVTSTETALMPRTIAAAVGEIGRLSRARRHRLATLYLGGGTPSLVDVRLLGELLEAVRTAFRVLPSAEVTLEANPDDVTCERVLAWRELGVTRVSLGVQAFQDGVLARLSRRHDAAQARAAAALIREAGLTLSLDLMLGLPGLGVRDVEANVRDVLAIGPHHVSVYLLEMDKPHRLAALAARRPDLFPDEDAAATHYLAAGRMLVAAGYMHYEISNFARPGFAARHNTRYWRGQTVFAAGVAAHGQAGRRRWANVGELSEYLRRAEAGEPTVQWSKRLDDDDALRERVMVGLRLARGVAATDVDRCGRLSPPFRSRLEDFLELGLARRRSDRVRLTPRGWLLSNELLATLW